jgi:acid phosphatase
VTTRHRRFLGAGLALLAGMTVLSGCTSDHNSASSAPATATKIHPSKVLVVIEENHSYAEMKSGMPYLFGLSNKYGYATDWTAISHPSLPNYLAIAGGSTFGVTNDAPPVRHRADVGTAQSVFDQALDSGKTAKTYAESMPGACYPTGYPLDKPLYVPRHNPWTYFPASLSRCRSHDVAMTEFAAAARSNALPNVGFLIPNMCHDAHDCPLAAADAFLRKALPDVLASRDFTSGRLAVVVTADEDDKSSGNTVLTSVLSTRLANKVVSTPLTHYSLTRYIAQVLGVTPLKSGQSAPDMKAAFGL